MISRTLSGFIFISFATSDYYGNWANISYEDEMSGKLTCAGTVLRMEDHRASLLYNIRYSITADANVIRDNLERVSNEHGCEFVFITNSAPGYYPKEKKVVSLLTDVFNEITGLETKPYVMGGGTYARKLPNAMAYGLGGVPKRDGAPVLEMAPGHGGVHEPDEMLEIQNFLDSIKVFTVAILALNELELSE